MKSQVDKLCGWIVICPVYRRRMKFFFFFLKDEVPIKMKNTSCPVMYIKISCHLLCICSHECFSDSSYLCSDEGVFDI